MLLTDSNRLVAPVISFKQITLRAPDGSARSIIPVGGTISKAFTTDIVWDALIDGSSFQGLGVSTGDIVLLTAQTNPVENGIYTVNASPNPPTRLTTAAFAEDLGGGSFGYTLVWKFVVTQYRYSQVQTVPNQVVYISPGVIDTDPLTVQETTNFGNGVVYNQSAQKIFFINPAGNNAAGIAIGPTPNANAFTLNPGDPAFEIEAPVGNKLNLADWYWAATANDKLTILYV